MRLKHDQLLQYQGLNGLDGVCHVRVYRQLGRRPVVIAGELDDNPGTQISNAIEMVAEAVRRELLHGWPFFTIVQHRAERTDSSHSAFLRVRLRREWGRALEPLAGQLVVIDRDGTSERQTSHQRMGVFYDPRWSVIEDIEQLVRCPVKTWPPGEYTAYVAAGDEGELLRQRVAARARATADALWSSLRETMGEDDS